VALILPVVGLGAASRFTVLPHLGGVTSPARPAEDHLARYVAWEAAFVLLVLGCTALLTELPPPRHRHAAGVEPSDQELLDRGTNFSHVGARLDMDVCRMNTDTSHRA
jgi:hypothetical protein